LNELDKQNNKEFSLKDNHLKEEASILVNDVIFRDFPLLKNLLINILLSFKASYPKRERAR